MIDFKEYIDDMIEHVALPEKANAKDIVAFFVANEWFGHEPSFSDGKVLLNEEQVALFTTPLTTFLSTPQHSDYLIGRLKEKFPLTTKYLLKFYAEENLPEDIKLHLTAFLLRWLNKDLALYNDDEVSELLTHAVMALTKGHGDCLTFFMAWLRVTAKTAYYRDYIMEKRYTMDIQNQAYDFNEYLELVYYLFNADYVEDNDMYKKAADSKNYTDTWLFLSMHFICSIRYTDLQRIHHPDLPYPAEDVLQKIRDNTFTDNDARTVLLSITTRMDLLPLYPNKTEATTGVTAIRIHFPTSCEAHFGKLFALAEAHRQLDGTFGSPIIRKISTYEEITRYMGEEIGELFLESDFRSRSATKSYLQSIYMLADDILDNANDGPSMKGYLLAALARNHKGSYGEFAGTTFEYLKDAKFSGLTPEFVMFELFERGVLSFIPSMLLKMVTNDMYDKLSVSNQTVLSNELGLSPWETESIVGIVDQGRKQAEMVIKEVFTKDSDILAALHNIGSGQAFSKQSNCLCLLTAVNKLCPYATERQCIGCKYEISTKSTLYLMVSEVKRLRTLYKNAIYDHEKGKYEKLLTTLVAPKIAEMFSCIKESYGEEVSRQYEELIREML